MVAGLVVATAMNPLDVISTRLFAQGTGVTERYNGFLDCTAKTVKAEGFFGVSLGMGFTKEAKGWRWGLLCRGARVAQSGGGEGGGSTSRERDRRSTTQRRFYVIQPSFWVCLRAEETHIINCDDGDTHGGMYPFIHTQKKRDSVNRV